MRLDLVANAVAFQVGWFACVLGAASGNGWIGPLFVGLFVLVQLWISEERWKEVHLLLGTLVVGWSFDTVLIGLGYYSPVSNVFEGWGSSPWLVAMWVNFALTLRHSMRWLKGRYGLGAVMGAVSGPLAYHAGIRLGAMTMLDGPYIMTLLLSIGWAIAVPLLIWLAWREDP